jgi:hypothetical protein
MPTFPRPSYAGVASTLALILALSGTSYAAVSAAKGRIDTADIKNGAVTTPKIKNNAVTPAKLSEYSNSGLVKLNNGENKVMLSEGPFKLTARCTDIGGGGSSAELLVKNVGTKNALFESDYESNYADPVLEPGEILNAFYPTSDTTDYWYGEYYNMFSMTSANGSTSIMGQGNIGVKVLGADCAFQLFTQGS